MRSTLPFLPLVSGCWVLTEQDLSVHDRALVDRPVPTEPEPDPTPETPTDTDPPFVDSGDPEPVACTDTVFAEADSGFAVGASPAALAVGDLDGDGDADLVVGDQAFDYAYGGQVGAVTWALNDGAATFTVRGQVPIPFDPLTDAAPCPEEIAIVDFDGNGRTEDVVVIDRCNDAVWHLAEDGGDLEVVEALVGSQWPNALTTDDLDGNGSPDVAVVTSEGFLDRHLLMDDAFETADPIEIGGILSHVEPGDLNGDGVTDLAIADNDAAHVRVWTGLGDGAFEDAGGVETEGRVNALRVADVNADGSDDIVVVDDQDGVESWLTIGPVTWGSRLVSPAGRMPIDLQVEDFRGEGCRSAVVANEGHENVTFLRGLGDGTFDVPVAYATIGGPVAIVVDQLDGVGTPMDFAVLAAFEGLPGNVQIFLGEP